MRDGGVAGSPTWLTRASRAACVACLALVLSLAACAGPPDPAPPRIEVSCVLSADPSWSDAGFAPEPDLDERWIGDDELVALLEQVPAVDMLSNEITVEVRERRARPGTLRRPRTRRHGRATGWTRLARPRRADEL